MCEGGHSPQSLSELSQENDLLEIALFAMSVPQVRVAINLD